MSRQAVAVTNQDVLWAAVIAVAGLLRLVSLGWLPLSDAEASAALSTARGALASPFWTDTGGAWGGAAYHTLTGWLFQVFGTSDAAARFIPAAAGLGLVLLVLRLRSRFGGGRALVLMLLLAVSPVMLVSSRTAGGTSLAVLGVGLFLASAFDRPPGAEGKRHSVWMGVGLGLALCGGPSVWEGLLSLGIAVGWRRWRGGTPLLGVQLPPGAGRALAAALAVTSLGLAVQFGAAMDGLGVALQSPAQWLAGWTQSGSLPLRTGLVLLLAYEPLILVFGLVGAGSVHEEDDISKVARVWALVAAIMFLLRPGRAPEDLVWVVLPLAALASLSLTNLIELLTDGLEDFTVYLMAGVLLALAIFAYLQVAGYINAADFGGQSEMVTLGLVLTALGFAASIFLLYGMTWSWNEAFHAAGAVGALLFSILTIAAAWRLAFPSTLTQGPELWRPTSASPELRRLETTLEQVSMADHGERVGLAIRVQAPPPPALAWILRREVGEPASAASADNPPKAILLPASDNQPSLPGTYVGQTFGVDTVWGWNGPLPPDGLQWWLLRKGASQTIDWVLYVHSDTQRPSQGGEDGSDVSPPS